MYVCVGCAALFMPRVIVIRFEKKQKKKQISYLLFFQIYHTTNSIPMAVDTAVNAGKIDEEDRRTK